jgi:ABC-2 type transport system ATP-binding protein
VRDREHVDAVARALDDVGDSEPQVDHATSRVTVMVGGGAEHLASALKPIEERGIVLDDVALRPPRLDEAFLTLTGQALPARPAEGAEQPRAG